MLFQLVLNKISKNYQGLKKEYLEYAENIKMLDGTTTSIFQEKKKFDKDQREAKIDELCKQVENHYLMIIQQPRQAPKQTEPVCYRFGKKGRYASHCRMEQEHICCKYDLNGHEASECRSKVDKWNTIFSLFNPIPFNCVFSHFIPLFSTFLMFLCQVFLHLYLFIETTRFLEIFLNLNFPWFIF